MKICKWLSRVFKRSAKQPVPGKPPISDPEEGGGKPL